MHPDRPFPSRVRGEGGSVDTRFIEFGQEINAAILGLIVGRVAETMTEQFGHAPKDANMLLMGLPYRKAASAARASLQPSRLLRSRRHGAFGISCRDLFVSENAVGRDHSEYADAPRSC